LFGSCLAASGLFKEICDGVTGLDKVWWYDWYRYRYDMIYDSMYIYNNIYDRQTWLDVTRLGV
jgi:hypothetical protein